MIIKKGGISVSETKSGRIAVITVIVIIIVLQIAICTIDKRCTDQIGRYNIQYIEKATD